MTLKRKVREILLSTTLITIIPRKKIPLLYLQVAYFGANMNGLKQALNRFNISNVDQLTPEIAAEIISRIKYPEPKFYNSKRSKQILLRKKHLLYLYKKHSSRKFLTIYR
jgi:penicillin-binding protein 1A